MSYDCFFRVKHFSLMDFFVSFPLQGWGGGGREMSAYNASLFFDVLPKTPWPVCRREVGAEGQCTCPPGYGKCKNAMCLPMDLFCNNVDDCGDESDEGENCTSCVNRLR